MVNENGSPTNQKKGDYINIGTVTFAILILTIAIFTTLLNTKQLAAIDTKTRLLEARLVSQEKISSSLKKQFDSALVVLKAELENSLQLQNEQQNVRLNKLGIQLTELETVVKSDREILLQEQDNKLAVLIKAQLEVVKAEMTSLLSQQDEHMLALAEEQNLNCSSLEAQLETVKEEMTSSLAEQNEELKALSNQVIQLESNLKEVEPVVLPEEPKETLTEVEPESLTVESENAVEPESLTVETENAVEPENHTESSN